MIGGAASIIKLASLPFKCATNDQCDMVNVNSSGGSTIGMDLERPTGGYPTYNRHFGIISRGANNNWLIAGNTFTNIEGDGEIEIDGNFQADGPTLCITGWRIAYNTFKNCGS